MAGLAPLGPAQPALPGCLHQAHPSVPCLPASCDSRQLPEGLCTSWHKGTSGRVCRLVPIHVGRRAGGRTSCQIHRLGRALGTASDKGQAGCQEHTCPSAHKGPEEGRSISIPAGLIPARSSHISSPAITKAITKKGAWPSGQWLGRWRLSPESLGTGDKKEVCGGVCGWGREVMHGNSRQGNSGAGLLYGRTTAACLNVPGWALLLPSCQLALPPAAPRWHRTRPSPPQRLPAAAAPAPGRSRRRRRRFSGATLTPSGSAGGGGGLRGREAAFSPECEVVRLPTPTRGGPGGHQSRGRRRGGEGPACALERGKRQRERA